ncbi:MAG: CDP-2,3-bis-(O-geranylgeranyl)-sn-glycerol synthase [Acidilobaceae archaeon]|nr:CDP-2,3-bis-(O-geranylgeranyl)-sn-glycerol synthase [Acidilobaceae archaeon]MDW7974837.1 CDP-2,3-bis-(O-geranylgeranyl)-sn-glycerol synthase [Sulfolobales archaeon]
MAVVDSIFEGLVLILPAMIANATPVIAGGKTPIDMGINFVDGRRLLGKGKTWEGLVAGILAGTFTGVLLTALHSEMWWIGFTVSVGAMAGDLTASFLKRRLNMESGAPAPIIDQLNYYVGAVAALYLVGYEFTLPVLLLLALIAGLLHFLANVLAYIMGLKEHPW